MIRVAYFGLPLGALLLAADGVALSSVVLSPTDAPGRRRLGRVFAAPVVDAAGESPARFAAEVDEVLARTRPDLIASWYFTRRIEQRWLDTARLGGIGAHPSILPRHRGPNPFFAAIDSGDRVTGVTVHALTERYDEGDVLATEELRVGDRDAWQLARALDRPSLRLFRRVVGDLVAGSSLPRTPQQAAQATWAEDPSGELLRADFRWTTERVLRRIRALSPVPGLALSIRGVDFLVTRAEATNDCPLALVAGEASVLADGVTIRTGDGAVVITRAVVVDEQRDETTDLDGVALAARLTEASESIRR